MANHSPRHDAWKYLLRSSPYGVLLIRIIPTRLKPAEYASIQPSPVPPLFTAVVKHLHSEPNTKIGFYLDNAILWSVSKSPDFNFSIPLSKAPLPEVWFYLLYWYAYIIRYLVFTLLTLLSIFWIEPRFPHTIVYNSDHVLIFKVFAGTHPILHTGMLLTTTAPAATYSAFSNCYPGRIVAFTPISPSPCSNIYSFKL